MKYFFNDHSSITVTWSIYKGAGSNRESFDDDANLKVFLQSECNTIFVEHSINADGDVVFETPESLLVGVYSVYAIWIRNNGHLPCTFVNNRNLIKSEAKNVFAISSDQQYATDDHSVSVVTGAVPYGIDGLSIYEIAVFHGYEGDEKTWVETYEEAEDRVNYEFDPSNDGEEQGDHESWAHKVGRWETAEAGREDNEAARQINETTRQSQETTRQSQETTRQNQETTRQDKEAERQLAEAERQSTFESNEQARQDVFDNNEQTRQDEFDAAQESMAGEFTTAQQNRSTAFSTSQGLMQATFSGNEQNRQDTFEENEEARQGQAEADHEQFLVDHLKNISSVDVKYNSSSSAVTPPATGWSSEIPTVESGRFLWTRTTTRYNGYPTVPDSISYSVGLLTLVDNSVTIGKLAEDAKRMIETHPVSQTIIANIEPNILHVWAEAMDTLRITSLATPEHDDIANEYMFQFTTSADWEQEESPFANIDGIVWNDEPVCKAECLYEVSILNGVGIIMAIEIENE